MPRGRCPPAARHLQLPNFCSKGDTTGVPPPRCPIGQASVVQALPCGLLSSDFPLCMHRGAAPSPCVGPTAGASLCQEPFVHSRSFQRAQGAFGPSQAPPSCPQGSVTGCGERARPPKASVIPGDLRGSKKRARATPLLLAPCPTPTRSLGTLGTTSTTSAFPATVPRDEKPGE